MKYVLYRDNILILASEDKNFIINEFRKHVTNKVPAQYKGCDPYLNVYEIKEEKI